MQYSKPMIARIAPHHTLAWKSYRTTLTKGGWEIWYTPAPKISTPFTSNEMPMKNQIEIECHAFAAYQKMMFKITNTTETTAAQNHGR